jgi:hypothetical protein
MIQVKAQAVDKQLNFGRSEEVQECGRLEGRLLLFKIEE